MNWKVNEWVTVSDNNNQSVAEVSIFPENLVNATAADVLAPCVVRASAVMAFTLLVYTDS